MAKSIDLLKNCESFYIMNLVSEDISDVSRLSVFERFAFLCDNIDALIHNKLREDFLKALAQDLGGYVNLKTLKGRENQKRIWRALFDPHAQNSLDIKPCEEFAGCDGAADKKSLSEAIDIADYIFCVHAKSLEDAIEKLAAEKSTAIYLGVSVFEYVQPDGYHCEIYYKRLKNREGCSAQERSALSAWVVCRTLMRRNFDVYVEMGDNIREISKLLDLLERRRLFPKIYLCCKSDSKNAEEISRLCLKARMKNVYVGVFACEGLDCDAFIKKLAYYLPRVRIFACNK